MNRGEEATLHVEAAFSVPAATVRIVSFVLPEPIDSVSDAPNCYRLNLCLTPRPLNSRACFADRWGPHRFEPLGDIFLVPPEFVVHSRGGGGRQLSVVCDLNREAVDRWIEPGMTWTDRRLEAALDISSPHIRSLLNRLAEEAYRPGYGTDRMVELIADQLAIEIGRFCEAVGDGPATGGLAAWRLRVIDERLRDVRSPPQLEELSKLCSLSVRQLTRGFRASRGCSISDYIERTRIEGAKRLLAGRESIKSIAFAMGFSSPSSFAHAFRRTTGSTPRQFRQRVLRPRY